MDNILVSIIVTTHNSERTLFHCLNSIKNQSYKKIEVIVVDGSSDDNSILVAKYFTRNIYRNIGPERSAKRNYGVKMSNGSLVFIVDSDMILDQKVVESCVSAIKDLEIRAVVVPEKSIGKGIFTQIKSYERSFYEGVSWMEAARFFRKEAFEKFGGYDEENTGSEDFDLPNRIEYFYGEACISRIYDYVTQDEGEIKFIANIKKKFYYANGFMKYSISKDSREKFRKQSSIINRYLLYIFNSKFYKNPLKSILLILFKLSEFIALGLGYIYYKYKYEK